MTDPKPDNVDIKDKVIATLLEEKRTPPPIPPRPSSNYELIQALTAKFAFFIESEKIPVPSQVLSQITSTDAASKLAFIKQYLSPRLHGLEGIIKDSCSQHGITLEPAVLDKCVRYLKAMAEIADA